MPSHVERVDLPYTPEQVFDLVADIESYPRFLPHVTTARITARDGNTLLVDQQVGFKILNLRFRTRAVLERPLRITVTCEDSAFGRFTDQWSFAPTETGGTRLQCRTEFTFRSLLFAGAMGAVFGELLRTTVRGFQLRAHQLYDRHAP
jgi:coenzyme Q-binding protein COQ10